MHVLFVAGEAAPFVKTGGLADVVGSLPKALVKDDVKVSVMIPKYKNIETCHECNMELIHEGEVALDWRRQYCGLQHIEKDGVDFYFVDNEFYFHREDCYGEYDDAERFSFFCKAAFQLMPYLKAGKPDVLHLHDWHVGPMAAMYKTQYFHRKGYEDMKVVYTIHNLKYQGIFGASVATKLLGLSRDVVTPEGMEFYGNINFMKAGIVYSDKVTTVSKTYAQEIKYPYYGEKLDGLLRKECDKLIGIVNGIDYSIWNPETDPNLIENFSCRSPKRKRKMKESLQECLGLPVNGNIPMLVMVSRLVEQKGLDLFMHVLPQILDLGVQVVVLGVGDDKYEGWLLHFADIYPDQCKVKLYFDEILSHRLYACGDMFLMPSKFEPCGIGQLIAMRYGAIPIARRTGGLADTITPYNVETGEGTGYLFNNFNAHEMLTQIERAVDLYRHDEKAWRKLIKNAMQSDFSWLHSAKLYKEVYRSLIGG